MYDLGKIIKPETSSYEMLKNKEKYLDTAFVRAIKEEVEKIGVPVYIYFYEPLFTLVFMYEGIIIHKIILNEDNLEAIPIQTHIESIKRGVYMLKNGFIPFSTMNMIKERVKDINLKSAKKI